MVALEYDLLLIALAIFGFVGLVVGRLDIRKSGMESAFFFFVGFMAFSFGGLMDYFCQMNTYVVAILAGAVCFVCAGIGWLMADQAEKKAEKMIAALTGGRVRKRGSAKKSSGKRE